MDSADAGDGVRRSGRKRIAKRLDSPSPPPPKRRGPRATGNGPTQSTPAARIPHVTSSVVLKARPPPHAAESPQKPTLGHDAQRDGAVVRLTKSTRRIEDDPRVDESIRREIAELRAANDTLASSNGGYAKKIKDLGSRLSRLKKKLEDGADRDSIEAVVARAKQLLNLVPAILFSSQLRNCGRPPGSRRFTEADLLLANAIHRQSPRCYLFLSKVFAMPGIDGLLRWVAERQVTTGKPLDKDYYEQHNLGYLLDAIPFQNAAKSVRRKPKPPTIQYQRKPAEKIEPETPPVNSVPEPDVEDVEGNEEDATVEQIVDMSNTSHVQPESDEDDVLDVVREVQDLVQEVTGVAEEIIDDDGEDAQALTI
ncbi:unnamed protein product [Notodromas monacha]|uniref:Uncharacterized protein n=1 Tax=Notodromas monacha TaxID=399045 RepID=A0A7R9BVR3_9CRUS|nr:unnamed protein product [Notodromas monacha]CAG0921551.1 unnamed protein product [Notodromas monacha]